MKKAKAVSVADSANPTLEHHSGSLAALRGCTSWQDIHTKWRSLPEKQKGDFFKELVKAYFQFDPEFAGKLKRVWLQREVPQAAAKRLKLPSTDQGFGIIAESRKNCGKCQRRAVCPDPIA